VTDRSDPSGTVAGQPPLFGIREILAAGWEAFRTETEVSAKPSAEASSKTSVASPINWLQVVVGIFLMGVFCGLVRLVGGLWGIHTFVRTSRPLGDARLREQVDVICAELNCAQSIELRESPLLETAATVGWRRPVILISDTWKTWSRGQIRSVLAHEIAHITRADFVAGVAAQLGLVLHFYHPLMHWLVNSLRLEQELAADALAAGIVGGPRRYLHAIGELALKQTKEPLSWPAQTFLPTRRTFLRRIEMLRDLKLLSGPASGMLKASSIVAVAAVTLVVAGFRPPGEKSVPGGLAAQDVIRNVSVVLSGAAGQQPSGELEATYVPADAVAVAVARPAELLALYLKIVAGMATSGNLPLDLSEDAVPRVLQHCSHAVGVLTGPMDERGPEHAAMVLTFTAKEARDAAMKVLSGPREFRREKLLRAEFEISDRTARYLPDDTTLIFGNEQAVQKMILAGPKSLSALTQTDEWHVAAKQSVAVAVDTTAVRGMVAKIPMGPVEAMFSPLWTAADRQTLGLQIGKTIDLSLMSMAADEANAKRLEVTLSAGAAMLSSMITAMQNGPDNGAGKAVAITLGPVIDGHKLARSGNLVTLNLSGSLESVVGPLTSALSGPRVAAQRSQQTNNIKQLLLALHNYHDVYGHFPPAVVFDTASNMPRSWRVEVLPFIEQAPLYEQYRKNEPWDSEANRKVLAQMPRLFSHPSQRADSNTTAFVAAYGKGLIFEELDKDGTRINEILDGTSNTIALIEAPTTIPWTKPEELVIDLTREDALPRFGFEDAGFVAGFADGSARFIARTTKFSTLTAILTRAGGEIVESGF